MKLRNLAIIGAAAGLAVTPAISASAANRTSAPAAGESELAGGALYAVLAVAVVAAFTAITIAAEDDDDEPVSA